MCHAILTLFHLLTFHIFNQISIYKLGRDILFQFSYCVYIQKYAIKTHACKLRLEHRYISTELELIEAHFMYDIMRSTAG